MSTQFNGQIHFSANGDAANLLLRLSNLVGELQGLGINLRTTVTLTAEGHEDEESMANPTPAARPERNPDEPQDPAQWDLTPKKGKYSVASRTEELAAEFPSDLDEVVAGLELGHWTFRRLPKDVRERLIVAHGAQLATDLQRAPSHAEFDRSKPFWMSTASAATMTYQCSWTELQERFASGAER
jgi:hypothetical protein